MKGFFVALVFCSMILAPPVQSLAAERGLLDPKWDDPDLARARTNERGEPRALPAQPGANPREPPLSLPRWGFGRNIEALTSEERVRAMSPSPPGPAIGWPACATKTPRTEHVRDETGTWYVDNYNFGCLT